MDELLNRIDEMIAIEQRRAAVSGMRAIAEKDHAEPRHVYRLLDIEVELGRRIQKLGRTLAAEIHDALVRDGAP